MLDTHITYPARDKHIFSNSKVKKFQGKLQFTHELADHRGEGAGGDGDDASARLVQLKAENSALKHEFQDLRGVESALRSPAPAPVAAAPRPAPAHSPPPQQQHHRQGPGMIGGAARGAAGGAMKGAIAGAILPGMSAGDGAAAGAAVGAATGGVKGLARRRGR